MTDRDASIEAFGLSDSGVESDTAAEVFNGHAYTYPDSFCECAAYVGGYEDWRAHMADVVLASDWLAADRAAAEARWAQAVLAAVEAVPFVQTETYRQGWRDCAARAAAAAAGGGGA